MKLESLLEIKKDEKPLENIVDDGGYAKIFKRMLIVGDSLSSGEFETWDNGIRRCIDRREYAWGKFMENDLRNEIRVFSTGGLSAEWFLNTFAKEKNAFDETYKPEAYIFALGFNDLFGQKLEVGDAKVDVNPLDPSKNNMSTFIGKYATIISKYKEISKDAKFFFITLANEDDSEPLYNRAKVEEMVKEFYKLTEVFDNSYVIDLFNYGPKYDKAFKEKFYLTGHMNPMGYVLTAKLIESYMDYIIRSDFNSFKRIGLIGTKKEEIIL